MQSAACGSSSVSETLALRAAGMSCVARTGVDDSLRDLVSQARFRDGRRHAERRRDHHQQLPVD